MDILKEQSFVSPIVKLEPLFIDRHPSLIIQLIPFTVQDH